MDAWSFRFRVSQWLWWWRIKALVSLAAYFAFMCLALVLYSGVFIGLLFIPCWFLVTLIGTTNYICPSPLSLHVLSFVLALWLVEGVLAAAQKRYLKIATRDGRAAAISEALIELFHLDGDFPEEVCEPDAPPPPPRDSDLFILLAAGIVTGFRRRRERARTLWKLGADAIVPVLFLLAGSEGRVSFRELAEHWGEIADLKRVILALSAIKGVYLILSSEPKGMALMPGFRTRLLRAGNAHRQRQVFAA